MRSRCLFIVLLLLLGCVSGIDAMRSDGGHHIADDTGGRADEAVTFTNVSEQVGLPMIPTGTASFAWGDYNGDDYVDLLIDTDSGPLLYENNGPPTWDFTNVTAAVGLGGPGMANSVWGDYDNDGHLDIYSSWWEESVPSFVDVLWHNSGPPSFTFTNVTLAAGNVTDIYPGKGNVWADVDRDGFLDMYVVNWRTGSQPLYQDYFWHNNGNGTFTDLSESSGIYDTDPPAYRDPPYAGMGITSGDYNNDGWMDIYVSNYLITPNYLWENQRDLTFKNVAIEKNAAGNNKSYYYGHSAGSAFGDYNNDGFMDIFVANLAHKDPGRADMCDDAQLLENQGPPWWNFTDVREQTGIPITPKNTVEGTYYKDEHYFSANWADLDNDGDIDLFVPQVKNMAWSQSYVWRNNGDGTFTNITDTTGVKVYDSINGAWADYNNDGFMDIVVNGKAPFTGGTRQVRLFKNNGNSNHWVQFRLHGTENNAPGIGSRVKITVGNNIQIREVDGGSGSHGSQNSQFIHFGLGPTTTVDEVEVRWPNGNVQVLEDVAADTIYDVVEDTSGPSIPTITASKTVIDEDEEVTITATVTGSASSYEWDLNGDGQWDTVSGTTQVTTSYALAGTYFPGLRVLDATGTVGEFQTVPVLVRNVVPVNSLAFQSTVVEDEMVTFDASASTDTPSDIPTLEFNFTFGDGTYSDWGTGTTATHVYQDNGAYHVGLQVRDDDGAINETILDLTVVNAPPEAEANATFTGHEDSPIHLNGTGNDTVSDTPTLEYSWEFGDGDVSSWSNMTGAMHVYDEARTYNATFRVKDDDGATAIVNVSVTVEGVPPVAEALEPAVTVANEDDTLQFSGTGTDTASDVQLSYSWDFGDGNGTNWSDSSTASHAFDRKGDYTATFSVMDDDGLTGTDTRNITILNVLPIATILDFPVALEEDETGVFMGSGYDTPSDIPTLLYRWDFGDGNLTEWVTDPVQEHSYTVAGDFAIRFEVKDDDGEVSYLEETVSVTNIVPDCEVKADKEAILEDEQVSLSAKCEDSPSDTLLDLTWKVLGTTYKGDNLTLTFASSGQVEVEFTAIDDEGAKHSEKLTLRIKNVDPRIETLAGPTTVDKDTTATYSAIATDTPSDISGLTYTWEFGDGGKGTGPSVEHSFSRAGTWTVKVTAEDDDGAKASKEMKVTVKGAAVIPPDDDTGLPMAAIIGAVVAVLVVILLLVYLFVLRPRSGGPEAEAIGGEAAGTGPGAGPIPTTTVPPGLEGEGAQGEASKAEGEPDEASEEGREGEGTEGEEEPDQGSEEERDGSSEE